MSDFSTENLKKYKTAYSDIYGGRVEIVNVREDDAGRPILDCKVPGRVELVLFRAEELSDYSTDK